MGSGSARARTSSANGNGTFNRRGGGNKLTRRPSFTVPADDVLLTVYKDLKDRQQSMEKTDLGVLLWSLWNRAHVILSKNKPM